MTAEPHTFTDRLIRAAEAIPQNGGGPVAALRHAGLDRARALGLPTRKTEAWKYTPIERVLARDWRMRALPDAVTASDVAATRIPGLEATAVVLDAGRYRADLSDVADLPNGVYVGSLYEAPRAVLETHLGAYARTDRELFSALNAALLTDGVLVYVPRGVVLERPVYVLSLVRGGNAPFVAPRVLLVAEDGAAVKVIEQAGVVDGGEAILAPLTEVSVGSGANVTHYRIQNAGTETYEVSNTEAYLRRDAVFTAFTVTLSGA
ncbi:MAG TPA: SufD family Fe-S cluster assembly protein, partial [Rhodothermales bacterium]|nr:SufD family Fe-S cluster assembly protein [Rhodothermales bacterium]